MINKIITLLISILIGIILYQQISFNAQMSQMKSEMIKSNKNIADFKISQERLKNDILVSINESNNKKVNELNEKIDIIRNNVALISKSNNGLSNTTRDYEATIDNRSSASKDNYIKTINPLFTESVGLLLESSRAADECIEKAITLQSILDEQHRIINEKNLYTNDSK